MKEFLWLVPAAPYAGFLFLALLGRRIPRPAVGFIGTGSVGLSLLVTVLVGIDYLATPSQPYVLRLWDWMNTAGFAPKVALYLDPLSLTMIFVITFVGFLIHVYSTEFMADEEGFSRFFAWMNLFVGSMLVLVLADDLLLLYLGWEGVGLCSYLLIGFWYRDPSNGYAARKAFVVTRVGDAAMAVGLFLIYFHLGTLNIHEAMRQASVQWSAGPTVAVIVAALLLAGAVGKSAQLPLQVWLPDAMAGPTPVSALIHAATMVTAGVYLIGRTHMLFILAPRVMEAVAIIGGLTLLISGFSALVQSDIKRALAYSTISQIGYMFLALGVGAWSAAIFHFMTHAFFKALLFLCSGVVIMALEHEHDIFKMGGLRRRLPVAFWTFLIGVASLSALPLVTAGFYSKELILSQTWSSPIGGLRLWFAGICGAFLTSLYSFRLVFIVFFGAAKSEVSRRAGPVMLIPLVLLAFLSVASGFIETPIALGGVHVFSGFMRTVFPDSIIPEAAAGAGLGLQAAAVAVQMAGVYLAYILFLKDQRGLNRFVMKPLVAAVRRFWKEGWGFDRLYGSLFVRPLLWIAKANRDDAVDLVFLGMAWAGRGIHRTLVMSQSGRVRWYAIGIGIGAVLMLAAVII